MRHSTDLIRLCFGVILLATVTVAASSESIFSIDCITVSPHKMLSHTERNRLMFPDPPCQVTEDQLDDLAADILSTSRFISVTWEVNNGHCGREAVFTLIPRPYIRSLSFKGNHQISDSRLERASDIRKFQPFTDTLLNTGLIQLRDYYLTNGFPMVQFSSIVSQPDHDGGIRVEIKVSERKMPKAESFEYRITGYAGSWWSLRLKSVFGWFRWKARRRGLNMEQLQKIARREQRKLRESGYRNAEIDIHQEPGDIDNHPRVLVEIMVDKPVKLKFENVRFLTRRDIVHNWKRRHVDMDEKQLARLVDRTRKRLIKEGWIDAKVTSTLEETDSQLIARVIADKGLRRYIDVVNQEGRSPVDPDNIGSITGLHSPRLLGLWKTRPAPEALENAEKAMKTHLENSGYPRPRCHITSQNRQSGATDMTIKTESGPHRVLGNISFTGADSFDSSILMVTGGIESGKPFVRRGIKDAMTAMTRFYWTHGFADVAISATTQRTENVVDISFNIVEGPGYVLGPLILKGNVKTRSNLIYRLKQILPGDPFDMKKLGKWQESLYRSGVFESVSIRTQEHPNAEPPYQTVVMDLVERSTGDFETGLDFNTDNGVDFILELGERNLFGQALSGRISGLIGQNRWLTALSLSRPIFWGYPLENRLRASVSDDRTTNSYSLRNYEVELSAVWRWENDISLNMTYAYEREKVRDIDPDVADEIELEDTRSASLTPVLTIDHRNDPFRSTRGWFYRTRLKGSFDSLGSDAEFLRWDHDFRAFYPLNTDEDVIICGALRTGSAWTLGSSTLPAGERFFLGGASTNRGFEHNKCGPRTSDGDELGGLSYLLANLELRFHLAGRFHGAIFVDAGNVYEDRAESPYLRPSAGVGLRLETPIGPFRADFGLNLDPRDNEPDYVMQIALGHAF